MKTLINVLKCILIGAGGVMIVAGGFVLLVVGLCVGGWAGAHIVKLMMRILP